MKKILFILLLLVSIITYSQVGIGTTSPGAQLDINGDLKIRTVVPSNGLVSAKDSVLVVESGIVKRVTSKQIYDSHIKSFVKGTGGTSISLIGLAIGGTSYKKIAFNTKLLDENNDYDTSTYQFTAPKAGIYSVYVQYELTSLLAASDVGVAIYTDRGGTIALEAQEIYSSIAVSILVGTVQVSPPVRKTQTLVKLNAGDKIFFAASSGLSITVIGGSKSFFTIMQVE